MTEFDGLIEQYSMEQLMAITSSKDEYKRVLLILKNKAFKTTYQLEANLDKPKRADDYDSEDPAEY